MIQGDIERLCASWYRGIKAMIEDLETLIEEIDSMTRQEALPPEKTALSENSEDNLINIWRSVPLPDT